MLKTETGLKYYNIPPVGQTAPSGPSDYVLFPNIKKLFMEAISGLMKSQDSSWEVKALCCPVLGW